jgi:hypothetical protein
MPGKGNGGCPGKAPGGGGPPGKKGGGAPGGIIPGGGAAYTCGAAPYTPPVLESAAAGPDVELSLAPMSALWASSWALSSSSDKRRFSTLGRFACG